MDRASDSGSEGWGFESLPVYQWKVGRKGDFLPTFSCLWVLSELSHFVCVSIFGQVFGDDGRLCVILAMKVAMKMAMKTIIPFFQKMQ